MKRYDVNQRGMILMIDIEEELKAAQIKHIQKELEQLRLNYSDITDLEFLHILIGYEEMLELAGPTDERLLLYKMMYQNSINYLFDETQSASVEADLVDKDIENIEVVGMHISFHSKFLQLYIAEDIY
jgi:hypothetical protein